MRFVTSIESTMKVVVEDKFLFLRVSTVLRPTSVSLPPVEGSVRVAAPLIMVPIVGEMSVLFVRTSIVARPTKVSVVVGSVNVPAPLIIVAIAGDVRVLFVSV